MDSFQWIKEAEWLKTIFEFQIFTYFRIAFTFRMADVPRRAEKLIGHENVKTTYFKSYKDPHCIFDQAILRKAST